MSAKAVDWFVLVAPRRRTPEEASFAVELGFVGWGKLEMSPFDDWRDGRCTFVGDCCGSVAELVVRRGIASEHYALATGRARMRVAARILFTLATWD